MSKADNWKPETGDQRAGVLQQLDCILESRHFRTSRRSSSLLKHIVRSSVEGKDDCLKERLLGVEVFKRPPDYDTNADPVVRMAAGEVRKRLAQYYQDAESWAEYRIDLDPGSYVPEFLPIKANLPLPAESETGLLAEPQAAAQESIPGWKGAIKQAFPQLARGATIAVILLLLAGLAATWILNRKTSPLERIWSPFLKAEEPPLILIGIPHRFLAEAAEEVGAQSVTKDSHSHTFIALSDVTALAHVAGEMDSHGRPYRVQLATSTSITDLRHRPVILIGASNNPWTLRLTQDLRFFIENVTVNDVIQTARIVDRKNPLSQQWQISEVEPAANRKRDFAIVARYQSPITEGPVMVIAGLGFNATEGAGESVTNPEQLRQIEAMAPRNWDGKNFEAIVEVRIVDGKLASSALVTSTFW